MGFVPFNNVIKLEGIFTQGNQRVENVHHYLVDETPNVDTCTALAESYKTWWNDNMRSIVTAQLSLVMIRCTILEEQNSPGIEYSTGLPLSGLQADAALPNSVSLAVKWTTGLRGRSYRGRTYHLGMMETQTTDNNVNSVILNALIEKYADLIALPVDVGPAVMCIASRYSNNVERSVGVATPVISVNIDSVVDSQRRRLPGRGR